MKQEKNTTKPTRKELERLHRRKLILIAARNCFMEKGLNNTKLEEIAIASEFGKGTLYNYFTNKEELLWAMIKDFLEETTALAQKAIEGKRGTLRDKLRNYAQVMFSKGPEHELFHIITRENFSNQNNQQQERIRELLTDIENTWKIIARPIQIAMDAGQIRKGDPIKLAGLFDVMVRAYGMGTQTKQFPGYGADRKEVIDLIISTFFDGIELHGNKELNS